MCSDFLAAKYPIARKIHYCDWCGGVIKPGEKYFSQFQPENRATLKLHTECEHAMYREELMEGEPIISGMPRGLTEWELDAFPDREVSVQKLRAIGNIAFRDQPRH